MDFVQNVSNGFDGITFEGFFPYLGLFGLIIFVLVTVALAYHWWKYTFTGDKLVLPMAILYGAGSVVLLSVIISTL